MTFQKDGVSALEDALAIMTPNGNGPFHYPTCERLIDEGYQCDCDDVAGQVLAAEVRRYQAQAQAVEALIETGPWIYDCCTAIIRCDENFPDARRHVDGGFYVTMLEGEPDAVKFAVAAFNAALAAYRAAQEKNHD